MGGTFITFEGGEGSGKSTQVKLLCQSLSEAGVGYVSTREPGGSEGAEKIRELLVSGRIDAWDAMSETLLFCAARRDHITRLVQPALADGKIVVCDRFIDSTLVYQGIGKGIPQDQIRALHAIALNNFMPDLTFFLDIDPFLGLERAHVRGGDETRFEKMGVAFHQKIHSGFRKLMNEDPKRCVVVNASADIATIHNKIITTVNQRTGLNLESAA